MSIAETLRVGGSRRSIPWIEGTVLLSTWALGAIVACLLAWTLIPSLLLGWEPMIITSGSMSPRIQPGDIVLIDPAAPAPTPGAVIAFDRESPVVHRVVGLREDGSLITKGDASQVVDSDAVDPDAVIGTGRLLVPYLGLARTGLGPVVLGLLVLLGSRWLWMRSRKSAAGIVTLVLALSMSAAAGAAFAASTTNTGSSATAIDVAPPANITAACGLIGLTTVDVELTWPASPTPGVTGYQIRYDDPGAPGWVTIATLGPGVTAHTHSINVGVLGLGTHTYAVRAVVGSWPSEHSATDGVLLTQVLGVFVCAAV